MYKSTNNDLQNIHIKLKIELQRSTQHTHTTKYRVTRTTLKNLRSKQVPVHSQNPHSPSRLQPDTIRIKVKNIPLSADDGQIHRVLTLEGCEIQGLFRERLRVKGNLTNCETGDRLVICKVLKKPIPRNLQIGKYLGKM